MSRTSRRFRSPPGRSEPEQVVPSVGSGNGSPEKFKNLGQQADDAGFTANGAYRALRRRHSDTP